MKLTLATYNVHGCLGTDGRFDPERVAQVLCELDADIVALQEVDSRIAHEEELSALFERETGCEAIVGPLIHGENGHYGNVLLTRLPVAAVHRIDLSLPRREPRGAIDTLLHTPSLRLRIVATHLGLRPYERRVQVKRLLAGFEREHAHLTALLGDINEWFLWGRPLRWLHAHFGPTPAPATFPSRRPLLALDRIWIEPQAHLLQIKVHRSPLARLASDHLPLRAELAWHEGSLSAAAGGVVPKQRHLELP